MKRQNPYFREATVHCDKKESFVILCPPFSDGEFLHYDVEFEDVLKFNLYSGDRVAVFLDKKSCKILYKLAKESNWEKIMNKIGRFLGLD